MSDGQSLRIPVAHTEAYIIVCVADSDTFQRDGYDIHSDVAISFTQAILGGRIRTPGINGAMDVKVCGINSQNLDVDMISLTSDFIGHCMMMQYYITVVLYRFQVVFNHITE